MFNINWIFVILFGPLTVPTYLSLQSFDLKRTWWRLFQMLPTFYI